jgi:hypothetical protein
LQYQDDPQFEEELRTTKVKLSRFGKNLEKEDKNFDVGLKKISRNITLNPKY